MNICNFRTNICLIVMINCQSLLLFPLSINITKTGTIPALISTITYSMIWAIGSLTIGINLLVYKSMISSLLKWSRAIRNEQKLMNKKSLDLYCTAVNMGQKAVSDSIFLICTAYSLNSIAMLYRFFAYIYG